MGRKIFVGRLPQEASAEDLRQYFGRFGRIVDVYVPKVNLIFHACFIFLAILILVIFYFLMIRTLKEAAIEGLVL